MNWENKKKALRRKYWHNPLKTSEMEQYTIYWCAKTWYTGKKRPSLATTRAQKKHFDSNESLKW